MHFDYTINLYNALSAAAVSAAVIWRAGVFVAEMRALREDFQEHVRDDAEQLAALEAAVERLRQRWEATGR